MFRATLLVILVSGNVLLVDTENVHASKPECLVRLKQMSDRIMAVRNDIKLISLHGKCIKIPDIKV